MKAKIEPQWNFKEMVLKNLIALLLVKLPNL